MSKKTRRTRRMRNMLLVVSMMLVVAMASVGVTVAWLTAESDVIVNTFTTSDIEITLTESNATASGNVLTNSYKMVPGQTITKDPVASVSAESEDCWLFVKLEKDNNFDAFMSYTMADDWTHLSDGVYYRKVMATDTTRSFHVIKNDTVTVSGDVTKEQLNAVQTAGNYPKLTVSAYAVQLASFEDAPADAWKEIEPDVAESGNED